MNASSLCICGKFIPDSCTKNAPYLIYLGDSKVIGITMFKQHSSGTFDFTNSNANAELLPATFNPQNMAI